MKRRKFIGNLAGLGVVSFGINTQLIGRTIFSSPNYSVEQFEDKGLAHFSYAVMADKHIVLIDPQRNPKVYYDFAEANNAKINGVIETHPHADFVSSHLEIHKQFNVPIYSSSLTKAIYPLTAFDEGDEIKISDKVRLRSLYTPGHAPYHIAAVLVDEGKDKVVFSGDSLFLGDVGRPDLLDYSKESDKQRQHLAGLMYDTIHEKFAKLSDDVIVYPSHGAGSLCGKSIRRAASSTIGYEKKTNYAFEKRTKEEFVKLILSDQPFIPKYFAYDVHLNHQGADALQASIGKVPILSKNYQPGSKAIVIDARPQNDFKASHIYNAINIQGTGPFETWLGSIVPPEAKFYLVAGDQQSLESALKKAAAIGYESKTEGAFIYDSTNGEKTEGLDISSFNPAENKYTYLDVRSARECTNQPILQGSINIPLYELADRISEIPKDKPVIVYCGSGYRSATGASILQQQLPSVKVYDLGKEVGQFIKTQTPK
jgi:glyoxylase-like metal-dependent hydrolase (beta-lactamase superfamily II)/rhodanese-related sulfurtransferase